MLRFVPDEADPWRIVAHYLRALASGSYFVMSHGTSDRQSETLVDAASRAYCDGRRQEQRHQRSKPEVERFFAGLDIVPPRTSDPFLFAWLPTAAAALWSAHGPCEDLVSVLGPVSSMVIRFRGDYRLGHDIARTLVEIARTRGYAEAEPLTTLMLLSVEHHGAPVEDSAVLAGHVREGLLRLGEVHAASLTFPMRALTLLETAPSLDIAAEEIEAGIAFGVRTGTELLTVNALPIRQLVRALRSETSGPPGSFSDDEFDDAAYLTEAAGYPSAAIGYGTCRALSAVAFGDQAVLREQAARAMALVHLMPGSYLVALTHLLQALALAGELRSPSATDRAADNAAVLAELDACQDWLAARAAEVPANFSHLSRLVAAERHWAVGDPWSAAREFDAAEREVATRNRTWHRALILERAAAFHLAHGLEQIGRRLLADARRAWLVWGATGKVRDLDRRFPSLRDAAHDGAAVIDVDRRGVGGTRYGMDSSRGRSVGQSVVGSPDGIDLLGVLMASQALSSETNLDRLRGRVVEVLTALTGATAVNLALSSGDGADWQLTAADGAVLSIEEAGARGLLPLTAFRYAERTAEPLVVENAAADDRFARDPYLASLGSCSLLVVPVLSHGVRRAMLVLENRLTRGAFSADRLDAVQLIAGQLAVSLDNALAERFRSLVQQSADLTVVCDHEGTIGYASPAAHDLVGIGDAALIGRSVSGLLHPDDGVELLLERDGVKPGEPRTRQCRLIHMDGTERWVEATVTDLGHDPAVRGVMLHLRDITERHRLETELRHAQKLESIGQLSAGIAHEINTPIQFIGDNVRFLTDAFSELAEALRPAAAQGPGPGLKDLLDEIPHALTDMREGTNRVATIVQAMQALGQPGVSEKVDADLNEAIRNTLVVAANEIRPVADVVTDLADLPPVRCIPGDITQVLLNLLVNAAQAMAEKLAAGAGRGTLTVRTRRNCGSADGGTREDAVIEVQDTGIGIPPAIADRVFDQFFTTKEVGAGTGQGLAVAHTLIHDHHGGTISFTSTPGEGTTFTVRLPIRPPDRPT